MMNDLISRQEVPGDFDAVDALIIESFTNGERGYGNEAELVKLLRQSDAYIPELALVAEWNGTIIGHIILTMVHIKQDDLLVPTLILAPVSVATKHQNKGIGSALIKRAHALALENGHKHIVLMGHPEYYPRFGYRPIRDFNITFPGGDVRDACMGVELTENSLANFTGEIVYSAPFYEL